MSRQFADIMHGDWRIMTVLSSDTIEYKYFDMFDGHHRVLCINEHLMHGCHLEDICMESETIAKGNL